MSRFSTLKREIRIIHTTASFKPHISAAVSVHPLIILSQQEPSSFGSVPLVHSTIEQCYILVPLSEQVHLSTTFNKSSKTSELIYFATE